MKRKVLLDGRLIDLGAKHALSETPEALGTFATIQVTFPLSPTHNTSATSHLETFGDWFAGFCFSSCASHSGRDSKRIRPGRTRVFFKKKCNPIRMRLQIYTNLANIKDLHPFYFFFVFRIFSFVFSSVFVFYLTGLMFYYYSTFLFTTLNKFSKMSILK